MLILVPRRCFTVGWFWGAGKEFVQRFEGATMSYIKRVEPLKNECALASSLSCHSLTPYADTCERRWRR